MGKHLPSIRERNLRALRHTAERLEREFEYQAESHYGEEGRWKFYRDSEAGGNPPAVVVTAERAWIKALHAYYLARDGEGGVLGRYGRVA